MLLKFLFSNLVDGDNKFLDIEETFFLVLVLG
jgi:hypothetical protein